MNSHCLTINPGKGVWTGLIVIKYLGVKIDSVEMQFFMAERKVQKVMHFSKDLPRDI